MHCLESEFELSNVTRYFPWSILAFSESRDQLVNAEHRETKWNVAAPTLSTERPNEMWPPLLLKGTVWRSVVGWALRRAFLMAALEKLETWWSAAGILALVKSLVFPAVTRPWPCCWRRARDFDFFNFEGRNGMYFHQRMNVFTFHTILMMTLVLVPCLTNCLMTKKADSQQVWTVMGAWLVGSSNLPCQTKQMILGQNSSGLGIYGCLSLFTLFVSCKQGRCSKVHPHGKIIGFLARG